MNEFLVLLQAKLDEAKSIANLNGTSGDIAKLQEKLESLKLQVTLDPNAAQKLADDIGKLINQKIVISNIGIDTNAGIKAGQEYGKQVSQGISQGMSSASKSTEKVLRDFSELNDAKRKFVDEHDLISKDDIADAERLYDTVRKAFSEFGQVTVSKGSMNDGSLENMRVKIEQVNGEMKITRDFMLYFNESKNGFKLVDDDTIRTTEKMIQHLNEEKNIVNATNEEANAIKAKLAEQEKFYKNIKNEVNNLYSLKTKLLSADELQTAELEKQIKQTKERISYNNKQIDKKDLRDNSLDCQINDLEVAKQKQLDLASAKSQDKVNTKELAQAEREAAAALKERQAIEAQVNKIQFSIGDKGDTITQIKTLSDNFTKLGLSADEVRSKMNGVDAELMELKTLLNSGASNSAIKSQFDKLQLVLNETQNDLKDTRSEYSLLVSAQQRLNKANTIEAWKQKNTAITKQAQADTQAYIDTLRNLNVQMTKMEFNQISRGFKETEISMRGLNKLGASFKDQLSQAAESFTQWLSVSSGVMLLITKTKEAIAEIKELDNILTEISKTSDMTSQQLKQLGIDAYDAASKYGRTASDYLLGVQEMARSGFYGEKGSAMAEQSLLAQSAGDMNAELANNYILATNAAYKLNGEADKLNAVLDGQNSITNRNSVAMEDMATAMSEAGTVASSYRVSIEDLSAMIGTIESVTKLGGSEVGNAIKAILINLQNVTSDKIVDTLDAANASMTEFVNGTERLRNPIEILRDLAKTFNQLDENDPLRAEILTNIGQKYHAAKLGALLQNMEIFDKMLVDYSEGTGSALEESNKSAENLTGTLNKLSNSWTGFVNNIINSNELKAGVNLLNKLVEGATNLTSTFGSLGTIGLGTGLFAGVKNAG